MQNRNVLIVDDEPANLAMLGNVLKKDYILSFATSGAEALTLAARIKPALILLDISMPDMDGYHVCGQLKRHPDTASIPVIFVTGHDDIHSEEVGFAAGCVDYLSKPIMPPIVLARVRTHLSLVQVTNLENSYREAVYMLGHAGHFNDNDTGAHIWRMAAYAHHLAEHIGWTSDRTEMMKLAAPMHDTGKIGIPDAILKKPAALDPREWDIMKTHTLIGRDILTKSRAPLFELAAEIALHHHEKWDGTGYPNGLAGKAIPESARIVAVADVFDALSMKRPYKEVWPLERILDHMRQQGGTHFDPAVIEAFESCLPQLLLIKQDWDRREDAHEFEL